MDMIFCLRQTQEKCIEQNTPLYAVFIDFTKACDTVSRDLASSKFSLSLDNLPNF